MAKIGVIHYNFPGFGFEEFLRFCVDTGYRYVELAIGDVWDEKDPAAEPEKKAEAVRRRLDEMGLRVSVLSAGNDFLVEGQQAMDHQVARMERVAKLAKILGADILRTEGGWPKEGMSESQWVPLITEGLKRCVEFAPKVGIYFALDNHGMVTNDGDRQVAIFEAVGSEHVGANLDTMNYRWAGHDLESVGRFYDLIAPYTLHTHMKDGTGCQKDYRGAALGEGEIDLERAVRALKKAGYDGVWTAEYEGPEAAGGVGYARCFRWLQSHV